ncbi:MAG: hypothetical protein DMD94_00475 [Candidatus Rokuibacteriota bacterium]|nr:MAG: hypothetical protein DMD94_00475 [Candidatus Rokubacteria bacterium]
MSRAFRRWIFGSLVDQRGGTLVMGLMLVFIMTLLGVALFDMARLEARLKLDSQTGVQALEIAEAGLERGLHLLYLEFVCGPNTASPINVANCLNPPTDPNYIIDNTLPLEGVRKALTTDCPASLLPDGATGFKLLKADQVFGRGSYTLCVRQWPPHSPFAFGGTAGGIRGNALIAGSLQFVSCPTAGCVAVSFSGGGGMQNNYTGLNASLHDRIPWRFQDGTTVNTLGAVLKVKEGQVQLNSGSACIGKQESGSGCSGGGTPFQDTMSGVYTSGTWGGSKGNCSGGLNGNTTTNSRCNVWTSAQGPYPTGEPTAIPLLSDSTIIDGVGYRCFFQSPDPDGIIRCPNSIDPIPGGTNFPEYFYTNAWRVDTSLTNADCDVDGLGAPDGTGATGEGKTVLNGLQAGSPDPSVAGTAQAGSANSITLAADESGTDQAYAGMVVVLTGGSGAGQSAPIVNYSGATKVATVGWTWSPAPNATTTYRLATTVGQVSIPIKSSACLRQGGTVRQPSTSGRAQAGDATTITLAPGASATSQAYAGMVVQLAGGSGAGQIRQITAYNGLTKVATVGASWSTAPDATTIYRIDVTAGIARAATANTITLDTFAPNPASGTDQIYTGMIIQLTGGPGAGQTAEITDYNGSVATVGGNWVAPPYSETGTAQVDPLATQSTIKLAAGASGTNRFYRGMVIELTGGAGSPQNAQIIDYDGTTKVATIAAPWSLRPDASTIYWIGTPYRIQMISCKLRISGGQLAGRINRETDTSRPADFQPIRPDLEPINVYVKRLAGAPVGTPTLKTSDSGDGNMYYQGKIMILADNPAVTPGFEIDTGLMSATTPSNPAWCTLPGATGCSWCSLGPYLCGYAYPANHFVAMFTTGDILLGAGGTRHILGAFFAANTGLTARLYVNGGIGQTQIAGTLSAQQIDFTGAGGTPSLYQAPWNLGALPGAAGSAAGAYVSIVSSNWAQIQ